MRKRSELRRAMLGFDVDTKLLQKGCWQHAACTDDNRIVRNLSGSFTSFYSHLLLFDSSDVGSQHYSQPFCCLHLLDLLSILLLGPTKGTAPIGKSNTRAWLLGDTGCRFQGGITTANDQYMLPVVLFRIDETVDNLRQPSPGTSSLRGVPRLPIASSSALVS